MNAMLEEHCGNLRAAINNDSLRLPTLPEVALQIRDAVQRTDTDIPTLCELIERDAALTTRMLKVANSPLYRSKSDICSLHSAVSRFGLSVASNLATAAAMQQMFLTNSQILDAQLRQAWARSVEVASIAGVLARHFTKLRPDQATLAGLVHRIGVLPILAYAERHARLRRDADELNALMDYGHREIGRYVLELWNFPLWLQAVPTEYMQLQRSADQPDYVDVVTIASLQSMAGSGEIEADMDWSEVTALGRLGLPAAMECLQAEEIVEDVASTKATLH
ncbi:MAG: HDOD domain-containing protein [Pseudomonadota bacterium]